MAPTLPLRQPVVSHYNFFVSLLFELLAKTELLVLAFFVNGSLADAGSFFLYNAENSAGVYIIYD